MAENPREPPRQIKKYFIPSTYNPSLFSLFYGIKHSDSSPKVDLILIAQKLDKVNLLINKFLTLDQNLLRNTYHLLIIRRSILSMLVQSTM